MEGHMKSLQDIKQRYRVAMSAYEDKDFSAAAQSFAKISEGSHLYAQLSRYYAGESFVQLGLEQMMYRDYRGAIKSFTIASSFNHSDVSLPQYLARCFAELGRFASASHYSDRETGLFPRRSDPRIRLALSLWQDGQQEHALQALREGILNHPDQTEWYFQLGVLLAAREEYEDAMVVLEKVIELDSRHAEGYCHLALCHGATGDPTAAADLLSQAQQNKPNDPQIGLYLAMALDATARSKSGTKVSLTIPVATPAIDITTIEELTNLITEEPDIIEAFVALPSIEMESDTLDLLAAVLERAVLQQPKSAQLLYHQALIYHRLGRSEQAIASCERAIEINPQLVQALVTLGKLYQETDRTQDAAARLQQVIEMGYEYADVYFVLGCVYREQGIVEKARSSYENALRINAGFQAAREALESLAA